MPPSRGSTRSRPGRRPPVRSSTGTAATSPAPSSRKPSARGVHVFEVLDEQAAAVPAGSEGLVVRDDWQGNRSPYKNPQARGAIAGLSLAHGPGHIFRAIYEATACGTRHILEDAAAHGLRVERVFVGGGGAKSALWIQIHADILEKPIHLAREQRGLCAGLGHGRGRRGRHLRRLRRGGPRDGRHRAGRPAEPGQRRSLRRIVQAVRGSLPAAQHLLMPCDSSAPMRAQGAAEWVSVRVAREGIRAVHSLVLRACGFVTHAMFRNLDSAPEDSRPVRSRKRI